MVEAGRRRGLRTVQSGLESAGKAVGDAATAIGDAAKSAGERTGVVDAASQVGDWAAKGAETALDFAKGTGDLARRVRLRIPQAIRRKMGEDETKAAEVCLMEKLPDKVMESYLGVLVWLVHGDDRRIDRGEMCEIQLLMAQRRCSAEVRKAVREHLENPPGEMDMRKHVARIVGHSNGVKQPEEAGRVINVGLMKDAIRVQRATRFAAERVDVRDQPGIRKLAELLEMNDEQLKVIEEGCSHEESILAGDLSDSQIKRVAKEWAATAAGVGVPVAVVYGAGVTGLSAVGITSALATLGMGGLLGVSAMLTGIGVVIVGGGITYKGVRWVLNGSKRNRASVREMMLQEVLRIHQDAIIHLGKDLSAFGERVARLAGQTDRNRQNIDWLTREVALLSQSAGALGQLGAQASRFERDLLEEAGDTDR